MPETLLPLALAGGVLFVLLLWGLKPLWREPAVGWSLALFVIALLPQVATVPSERLLYFPFVPASLFLASLIASIPPLILQLRPGKPLPPRATRIWGWYLLIGLFLPGAILSAFLPRMYLPSLQKPGRDTLTGLPIIRAHIARRSIDTVIFLNTSGPFLTLYVGGILEYHLYQPVNVRVLSSLNGRMTLERTGPRSFVMHTDRLGWLSNMFARIVRLNPHLEEGRIYRNELFDATLVHLTSDRQDVLTVRFDFHRPLDDPGLLFMTWNGVRFASLSLSRMKPCRQRLLADTSDVWTSM